MRPVPAEPTNGTFYDATRNEVEHAPPAPLRGDVRTDVVVVGAGFTGLSIAIELAERGMRVVLVEQGRVGAGASGRNGGQVTGCLSGDAAMRRQMARHLGSEFDPFMRDIRWRGHQLIEQRIARYGIACDLKYGHLMLAYRPADNAALARAYTQAQRDGLGDSVQLLDQADVHARIATPRFHGGLLNRRNMHLHPLNLCLGEARAARSLGVDIREVSPVRDILAGPQPEVVLDGARIRCDHVVVAGDVAHRLLPRQLRGMIFPVYGGIVATAPLGPLAARINPEDLSLYDTRLVLDYHRLSADGRLVFGGGAHYLGDARFDVAEELRSHITATYPLLRKVALPYAWRCAMGVVLNRIPQLGRVGGNVWYCQGYSGHGIASSHVLAEIVAHAIYGQMTRFDAFAQCRHWRLPCPDLLAGPMLAAGALFYQLRERLG